MQVVVVCAVVGFNVYQVTVTHLLQWNRQERDWLQQQIISNERINRSIRCREIDPKDDQQLQAQRHILQRLDGEKCVYWKGKDITLGEANTMVRAMEAKHERLFALSPFDRLMKHVFE
jgi:hypothetical protein